MYLIAAAPETHRLQRELPRRGLYTDVHRPAADKKAVKLEKRAVKDLSDAEVASIEVLLERCMDLGSDFPDLRKKQSGDIFFAHDRDTGERVGFFSITELTIRSGGRNRQVIFTPQAYLDPPYRGLNVLQRGGGRAFARARLRHPSRPISWVFHAATYDSYLLATRNFVNYHPRLDVEVPGFVRELLLGVVEQTRRGTLDAAGRVVRPALTLLPLVGVPDETTTAVADIAAYAEMLPNQLAGERLAVYVPLTIRNLVSMEFRVQQRVLARRLRWMRRCLNSRPCRSLTDHG
jgi:hypothetical protein